MIATLPFPRVADPAVRRVTVGGRRAIVLRDASVRDHSADELAALRVSVAREGVIVPVMTADLPEGLALVDGGARVLLAEALGKPLPVCHLGGMAEADARALSIDLNAARRHLSDGELERARRDRLALVLDGRASGKSLKAIAGELDVSVGQVRRDLEVAEKRYNLRVVRPAIVLSTNGGAYKLPPPRLLPVGQAVTKAANLVKQLRAAAAAVLKGPGGPALRAAARELGVPVSDGSPEWPTLDALQAAFEAAADAEPGDG